MTGSGETRYQQSLCSGPALRPRRNHKREPVGWDDRVEKSDRESCSRERDKNEISHSGQIAIHAQQISCDRAKCQ